MSLFDAKMSTLADKIKKQAELEAKEEVKELRKEKRIGRASTKKNKKK